MVSVSACQAGGLWFKSGILPLLKHACGGSDWLLCWPYTPAEVLHQRWISGNVYHVHLCKVQIRQNPLWLWNPEETSPEVWNRGISGPKNGHVSNKNLKTKPWWHRPFSRIANCKDKTAMRYVCSFGHDLELRKLVLKLDLSFKVDPSLCSRIYT